MTIGGATLRQALRPHASGVVILTAPGPAGVTITSFTSISAEPALVGFALADTSSTWSRIRDTEWFGIQVLAAGQVEAARLFAAPAADRFASVAWTPGPHGVPLIDGCLSWLICHRYRCLRLGDHHLLVGEVRQTISGDSGHGLIHVHGTLRSVHPVKG